MTLLSLLCGVAGTRLFLGVRVDGPVHCLFAAGARASS